MRNIAKIISSHVPALEPVLLPDSRSPVEVEFVGPNIAFANARTGRNAGLFAGVKLQLEASSSLSKLGRSSFIKSTASAELGCAYTRLQPEDALERLSGQIGNFRHASATDTGVPDESLSTLIVDHAQNEDPAALAAEARRAIRPGGHLVLIGYGPPHVGDPRIDDVVAEIFRELEPFQGPLALSVRDGFRDLDLGLDHPRNQCRFPLAAHAKGSLAALFAYIGGSPAAAACEDDKGWGPAASFSTWLRHCWGNPKKERDVWFRAALHVEAAPGGPPLSSAALVTFPD